MCVPYEEQCTYPRRYTQEAILRSMRNTHRTFGERVTAEVGRYRQSGGTIKGLAAQIGVERKAIYGYMEGTPPKTPETLADLASAFGCTMDYLRGRADERTGLYVPSPEVAERVAAIADEAGRLAESLRPTVPGGEL